MWWQQIEKHLHLVCGLELPCLETRDTRSTSTALSASHRSEARRLGQRAINLLKCHFQREMDCRGGRGEEERGRETERWRVRYPRTNSRRNQITPFRSSSFMTKQLTSLYYCVYCVCVYMITLSVLSCLFSVVSNCVYVLTVTCQGTADAKL